MVLCQKNSNYLEEKEEEMTNMLIFFIFYKKSFDFSEEVI